jgi:hypothetical protein
MSYEEEIAVMIAQLSLLKKRVYELRRRAMTDPVVGPQRYYHKQGSDELVRIMCGLTTAQVRLSIAQFAFTTAKAISD